MYIVTNNTTNRSGLPLITSVRADSAWILEGSQSGWIYVSGTTGDNLGSLVSYSFSYPYEHQYEHGPFALTADSGVVYFYDNIDVYKQHNVKKFDQTHAQLTSAWTPAQMAAWDTKQSLLQQYLAMDEETRSGAVDTSPFIMLKYEAQERGISMSGLILNVIQPLADYYAQKHGQLYGRQKAVESQILAMSGTDEEIKTGLEAISVDYSDILS